MSIEKNGRVAIETDFHLNKELYAVLRLRKNELNLKKWFVESVENYIKNNIQERYSTFDMGVSNKGNLR